MLVVLCPATFARPQFKTTPFGASTDCANTQFRILQNICGPGISASVTQAMIDFENESIEQWLRGRGLDASHQQKIYEYGRIDLRSQLREFMFNRLLEEIRLENEPFNPFFIYFRNVIWEKEKLMYQMAVAEKNLFINDICAWQPNEAVALQYKLRFDKDAWCTPPGSSNLIVLFKTPLVPIKSYFIGNALQQVYLHSTGEVPGAAAVALSMLNESLAILGVDVAANFIATTALTTAINQPAVYYKIFPKRLKKDSLDRIRNARANLDEVPKDVTKTIKNLKSQFFKKSFGSVTKTAKTLLKGFAKSLKPGPGFVVGLMIDAGIEAGFRAAENDENFKDIKTLDQDLARVMAHSQAPRLTNFLDSDEGMVKLRAAWSDMTLPEMASEKPLPPLPGFPFTFSKRAGAAPPEPVFLFDYLDWDESTMAAYVADGWFVSNGVAFEKDEAVSTYMPMIKYRNWENKEYLAVLAGRHFLIVRDNAHQGDDCLPDLLTGVTVPDGFPLSDCHSYFADSIELLDQNSNPVQIGIPAVPALVVPEIIAFTKGQDGVVELGATGFPTPTIIVGQGTFPAGVAFSGGAFGAGSLNYDGIGGDATSTIRFIAAAGDLKDRKDVKIFIRTAPQITSPNTLDITAGKPVEFTVTATGSLPMALTISDGLLPPGVSFVDNGDGTAKISGKWDGSFFGACLAPLEGINVGRPCGITATPDALAPVIQAFTVNTFPAPAPAGSPSLTNGEMVSGVEDRIFLGASNGITPVHFKLACGPSWLKVRDNGDGTAILETNPKAPLVTVATEFKYRMDIWAEGDGHPQNIGITPPCFDAGLVHKVNVVPRVRFAIDDEIPVLTAGIQGTAFVTLNQFVNDPSVTISGAGVLPEGITFNDAAGIQQVSFSGNAPVGSGGLYPFELTVANSFITETLGVNLVIREKVKIVTEAEANFPSNTTSSFLVKATGFPHQGMTFSVEGALPGTITLEQEEGAQYATLSGNPGFDTGDHDITIVARNDEDDPTFEDRQEFVIHVAPGGDANSDGVVNCVDYDFVRARVGKRRGHVGFDGRADLNGDDVIDLRDVAVILRLRHLAGGAPCV